jgi:hypothetical protein
MILNEVSNERFFGLGNFFAQKFPFRGNFGWMAAAGGHILQTVIFCVDCYHPSASYGERRNSLGAMPWLFKSVIS